MLPKHYIDTKLGISPKFRITQPQNSDNITYNRNPNNIENIIVDGKTRKTTL